MIQQRGARWRVVVQAPRDPVTRRRRQLSGTATSESERGRLEADLRQRAKSDREADVTLSVLVDQWWASGPRLAATTHTSYRQVLDRHVLPLLGSRPLSELRPRFLAAFLTHLRTEARLAGGSCRKARTVLSSVMSFAVAMEYVDSNPIAKVPPPPVDATERIAPTVEETAAILAAAERYDREFATFLWVAAESGGRRGETLGLRWGSLDEERRELRIDRTVSAGDDGVQIRLRTKTNRPRRVALSEATVDRLRQHRRLVEERVALVSGAHSVVGLEDLVFSGGVGRGRTPVDGRPWRPDSTTRRFARVKRLAGVRDGITLHGLRHTMITEMLSAGVDPRTVMGRAGHASEAMTMQVYAKVRPTSDAAAAEMWSEMLHAKVRDVG